ncbi:MAG TPA: hypothetical protein VGM87_08110 [Roseomonas sp.]
MNELDRLKALLDADAVKLGVNIRRMNSPGSPIYRTWENVWPAGLILGGSLAGTALVHFYLGAAVLAAGAWWWLAKVHPRVKDGVFDRTAGYALSREAHMDALWAQGVLSLYAKLPDGRELAAAKRERWRDFVGQVEQERAKGS